MVEDNKKKHIVFILLILCCFEGFSQRYFSYEIYSPESPWGIYYARLSHPSNQNPKVHISIINLKGKGVKASTMFFCNSDTIQCITDTNGQLEIEFNSCPLKIQIHASTPLYGIVTLPINAKVGSQLLCNQIDTLYIVLGDDGYRLLVDSPFELDLNQIEEIRSDWIKNKCTEKKYKDFNIRGIIEI